jgi:hypothetical protein
LGWDFAGRVRKPKMYVNQKEDWEIPLSYISELPVNRKVSIAIFAAANL